MLLLGVLSGCNSLQNLMPGKKADYRTSRSEPTLEVPPDLSSAGIQDSMVVPNATYSEFEAEQSGPAAGRSRAGGVLPEQPGMRLERDGDQRWLVVEADAATLWPRIREFWLKNGFLLTLDDPQIGVMETDWAENRADIPQGPIRRVIGKALDFLYSAATRDKFRVRLERAPDGGTEIFLTHRGMEEVVQGTPDEETGTIWKPRPSDPELEAEMLKRLMVYLGTEEQKAERLLAAQGGKTERARLVRDSGGAAMLVVDEDFSRAWRRTGIALDRVGFTVEDRNRSQGLYYVRYNDPLKEERKKGILSRLKFWGEEDGKEAAQYRIRLEANGPQTRVTVLDAQGARDNSATARRILTLLQEQLK
ncbi:outer membrane protein assembly factor BamC [Thiohalobacter sp. IOR34]|uniref:outer membrane protein assembly factor BamC n=1 Tax=Thiohalobacter sp. IOR34 TaxID=3057176 RepID=UPI0025B1B45C|nr:outer membrane protein assembly factor BamC [Thiohalobacter sp. IOR34]WJW76205.1 outer membrane protein assembly factor BamC [Thiohalobacter sp. IOR34]